MPAQQDQYAALAWRTSSASADQGCVEVAVLEPFVLVRDSRNRSGAVLRVNPKQWREFLDQVRGQRLPRQYAHSSGICASTVDSGRQPTVTFLMHDIYPLSLIWRDPL